jgi:hypothetical protein
MFKKINRREEKKRRTPLIEIYQWGFLNPTQALFIKCRIQGMTYRKISELF